MSTFEAAIPVLLAHEGGYVNDPSDPGGETNWGISRWIIARASLTAEQLGLASLEPGALRELTQAKAVEVYRRLFWDTQRYWELADQRHATKVFDAAVNMGAGNAHRCAQKAAALCGRPVDVDGALGPLTVAAINAAPPDAYIGALCDELRAYYERLLSARPELEKFRFNWLRRARWPAP